MREKSETADLRLHQFRCYRDQRGALVAGEFGPQIPFIPKRYFLVHDVVSGETRGQHAHRQCEQFLTCVSGQCEVTLDNGESKKRFHLHSPTLGLYVAPMTWVRLSAFSPGAALLVFASEHYQESDYIRDYTQFIQEVSH